jgi:hypothetical protein
MQTVFSKLAAIQAEIHAPKSEYNQFGKYAYRTAEAILEAVKPLAKAQGCAITITDAVQFLEGRFYIKATATIISTEDGSEYSTVAFAREAENKAGMDPAQVTGAASSYARKYALNGLLCIDNTPDADALNKGEGAQAQPAQNAAKPAAAAKKKPTAEEIFAKWVEFVAYGKTTKEGVPGREAYIQKFHPTEEQLMAFDKAVLSYQLNNNIGA